MAHDLPARGRACFQRVAKIFEQVARVFEPLPNIERFTGFNLQPVQMLTFRLKVLGAPPPDSATRRLGPHEFPARCYERASRSQFRQQISDTVMPANLMPEYRAAEAAFRRGGQSRR